MSIEWFASAMLLVVHAKVGPSRHYVCKTSSAKDRRVRSNLKEIDSMAQTETLHDAFIDELQDAYDAEKQLTKALPKLAKAASSPDLRRAFEAHLKETVGHVAKLEQVFSSLDEKPRGRHCDGIAGII